MKPPGPLTRYTVLKRSSNPMVRTARLKAKKPMKRGSRRPVDPVLREAAIVRDGGCVLRGRGECWGRLDPHHVDPKGMGGRERDDVLEDLVILCRGHHSWAHDHTAEARALGVLV